MSRWMVLDPAIGAEIASIDWRPVIGECEVCKCDIHGADENGIYEADDGYRFEDGAMVCGDCLRKYCNENFRI